jgi:hypothetical protein
MHYFKAEKKVEMKEGDKKTQIESPAAIAFF